MNDNMNGMQTEVEEVDLYGTANLPSITVWNKS